ncbi:MAG TPA: class I SAM-dependent methyltransferase [Dehalococcoidia bacterium]|nr:class I SAM-dependent methyltransferase [Dehalococcoidia bacterium]
MRNLEVGPTITEMSGYDPASYGERIAPVYEEIHARLFAPEVVEPAVDCLAELAGGGPVLELGIGTGRIALPLAERRVEVHGVDASEAMVAKLRAKPGGDRIPVTMGDFATVPLEGDFSLIFVVFNTFFGLLTQNDQVACFQNSAAHLQTGGCFLIDAFVPDMNRIARGQHMGVISVGEDEIHLDVSRYDPIAQRSDASRLLISERGVKMYPVQIRWAWPSELDLMAQLAGLRLRERWGGWKREPFGEESRRHVSVYEKSAT